MPEPFRDLDRFRDWALPLERDRHAKRLSSDMEEIRALYETMLPRMSEIMIYLNQFDLDRTPDDAKSLLHLCLSFIEASSAVVIFGQPDVVDGFDAEHFVPIEQTTDTTD